MAEQRQVGTARGAGDLVAPTAPAPSAGSRGSHGRDAPRPRPLSPPRAPSAGCRPQGDLVGRSPPPGGARVGFAFCGGRVTSPLPLWRPYLTFSPSPAPRSPLPSWRLQTQCPQWGGARVLTRANSPVSSQVHRSDSVLCPSPRHVPLAAAGGAQLPARCAPCGLCSLLPAVRPWGPQRCTRGDL